MFHLFCKTGEFPHKILNPHLLSCTNYYIIITGAQNMKYYVHIFFLFQRVIILSGQEILWQYKCAHICICVYMYHVYVFKITHKILDQYLDHAGNKRRDKIHIWFLWAHIIFFFGPDVLNKITDIILDFISCLHWDLNKIWI